MPTAITGHSNPGARTSVLWFRFVLYTIGKTGLDVAEILETAGLEPEALSNPDAWLPDEYTSLLLMAAAEKSGDPDYGLSAGRNFLPSAYGPLGYSMMTSADLRTALEHSTHFTTAVTEATRSHMTCSGDTCLFEVKMPSFLPAVERLVDEYMMLSILSSFRWLVGREFTPLEIEFMHAEPVSVRKHIKAFGRKPVFSSTRCAFLLSREQLQWPVIYADDSMSKLHDRHASEKLHPEWHPTVTAHVRRIIQQRLRDGEPTLADIAAVMNLSERTLQRRLKQDGLTFHGLVDEVRRDLLGTYLPDSAIALKEIASLLGFADQSCFSRAVQRWYGQSPKALRQSYGK